MKKVSIGLLALISISTFASTAEVITMKDLATRICKYTNEGHAPHCLKRILTWDWENNANALEVVSTGCALAVNIGKEDCFKGMLQDSKVIPLRTQRQLHGYFEAGKDSNGKFRTKCDYESYNNVVNCYYREIRSFLKSSEVLGSNLDLPVVIF